VGGRTSQRRQPGHLRGPHSHEGALGPWAVQIRQHRLHELEKVAETSVDAKAAKG
jgi:hypothetical protein